MVFCKERGLGGVSKRQNSLKVGCPGPFFAFCEYVLVIGRKECEGFRRSKAEICYLDKGLSWYLIDNRS